MRRLMIVGASSGIGQALADSLSNSHEVWTASRHATSSYGERHVTWDATAGEFPPDLLPDSLDGLAYCPGSIRLQPFPRLTDKAFLEDFQLNVLGAVRVLFILLGLAPKPRSSNPALGLLQGDKVLSE